MENSTIPDLFLSVMKWNPRNDSYVIPGTYDIKLVDAVWVITTTLFIFTMQTGFAMVEAGIVSKKNRVNVMIKNVIDVCFGGLFFWSFGFGLAFGRGQFSNSFFGFGDFFVNAPVNDPLMPQILLFYFLQSSFSTTSSTIFSAAIAERVKISAYIVLSMGITFIYSVAAGWIWGEHGFLKNMGVIDFAGAGPIHITGGTAAFLGAWYVGPRIGRFDRGSKPAPLKDPLMACIGLFILWWGWIAFNAGSSYGMTDGRFDLAARAGAGTFLATVSAGCTSFVISLIRNHGKVNVSEVLFGIMSSLVAINAGCFVFSTYGSMIVGAVAAILYMCVAPLIDNFKIDDASTCTAIHLINGIWGHLSIGFFADPATGPKSLFIDGSMFRLKMQTISVICLTIWSFVATYILIKLVDWTVGIRLCEDDEIAGCDPIEHDIFPEECDDYPLVSNPSKLSSFSVPLPNNIVSMTPMPDKFVTNSQLYDGHFDLLNRRRHNSNVNVAYQHD